MNIVHNMQCVESILKTHVLIVVVVFKKRQTKRYYFEQD